MKEVILQELSRYEEDILIFVGQHHSNLKKGFKNWLEHNSISNNILAKVNFTDKICISKAKTYKVIIEESTIKFTELDQKIDQAILQEINNKHHIQVEINEINTDIIVSRDTAINDFELKLLGIHYYFERVSKGNILLHFDYLINKVILDVEEDVEEGSGELGLSPLPKEIPQQTFIEARRVAQALADGPRLIGWESITGQIGLRHVKSNLPIQPRIMFQSLQQEWQLPTNCVELRNELENLEQASILLLNVTIGATLERPQVTASTDDLISYIGWKPRSHQERLEMRRKVWRWLLLFDSISVHGKRPGVYQDTITGNRLDLTSSDALIKVVGKRFVKDDPLGQSVPLEVTWVAGPWLAQWRTNPEIITYFGDLTKIAKIATGKASGAWAQSIGLALHQFWRERITPNVFDVTVKSQLTLTKKIFTRFELLSLFRCEPWVVDLLKNDKPHRAKEYWKEAIRKLKFEAAIIGHYEELAPIPNARKGWAATWLKEQKLDIRPK